MKNIIENFTFAKLFYDAFTLKMPLHNFPASLQNLISLDILDLVSCDRDVMINNCQIWKDEAFRNIERIGKLGSTKTEKKLLILESNTMQDSTFVKALKLFNERNFYILSSFIKNIPYENNHLLIKTQMLLSAYIGINLTLPQEKCNNNYVINSEDQLELNPNSNTLIIQEKYLQSFIDSLSIYAFDIESKNKLKSLLTRQAIHTDIKFSCPANSVINFFKRMIDIEVIVSNKEVAGKFIQTHFLFGKKDNFKHTSNNNIINYLKRSSSPAVLSPIVLIEKC
ncbi:hypothetical protein [Epilithonimonas zeae]|uniref:hypothetical protein n=1 Tax=Epilithonimonas zeae TaxID=1416779 RepID=UPI00200CC248|nr:hypothetical protein [Epilithonimonas zeae]UQB69450.1 hypothetical protein KI430_03205 [Epilithonimonas zeae]